jgi:hypothetical protein
MQVALVLGLHFYVSSSPIFLHIFRPPLKQTKLKDL